MFVVWAKYPKHTSPKSRRWQDHARFETQHPSLSCLSFWWWPRHFLAGITPFSASVVTWHSPCGSPQSLLMNFNSGPTYCRRTSSDLAKYIYNSSYIRLHPEVLRVRTLTRLLMGGRVLPMIPLLSGTPEFDKWFSWVWGAELVTGSHPSLTGNMRKRGSISSWIRHHSKLINFPPLPVF